MPYLITPEPGYSGPREVYATKAEAKQAVQEIKMRAAKYGGVKYTIKKVRGYVGVSKNPTGTTQDIPSHWTKAKVKRLPGGRIQVRIGEWA